MLAIRRRKTAENSAQLYDESLPDAIRFHGLISRNPKLHTHSIEQSPTTELSPFILELRTAVATPEEILTEESYTPIRLNFLSTSFTSPTEVAAEKIDTSKDLVLSQKEINNQLGITPGFSLGNLTHAFLPSSFKRSFESVPLQNTEVTVSCSADVFIPKHTPENLLSYFDLPEDESLQEQEEESDEIFELVDLVASVQEGKLELEK